MSPSHADAPLKDASSFNRVLMLLVPDNVATLIGAVLVGASFALGFLEMLSKDFATAELYFYFSLGMTAFLITMKYMSLRASYRVAHASHHILVGHIRQHQRDAYSGPGVKAASAAEKALAAKAKAEERVQMMNVMGNLREALKHIEKDDPQRPKYEASIKMMEKILS